MKYQINLENGDALIFDTENPYNKYNETSLGWNIQVIDLEEKQ